jgi:hypothetical protein
LPGKAFAGYFGAVYSLAAAYYVRYAVFLLIHEVKLKMLEELYHKRHSSSNTLPLINVYEIVGLQYILDTEP